MKKLLLTFLLTIILTACGGNGDTDQDTVSPTDVPATAETTESTESTDPTAEPATEIAEPDDEDDTSSMTDGELASDYLGDYEIADTGFGTMVMVTVDEAANTRTIMSNALPNHETGEFPNPGNPNEISEQNKTWTFTTDPTYVGTPTVVREPGVAISGVKFEPDTAERANCDTGEEYRIEAIQEFTNLGLDFNNAHVQPTGEYHYHGVSELLVDAFSGDSDLVHVGFAADGHLMYFSKSGAYEGSYELGTGDRAGENCVYTLPGPSGGGTLDLGSEIDGTVASDWEFDASYGDLDQCNGTIIDGEYAYLITFDYPYIPRCLMGEVAGSQDGSGGGQGGAGAGGQQGGRPDFAAAAETLGITEQELLDAVGGPPPDFAAAAETLGIPEADIESAVEASRTEGAGSQAPPDQNQGQTAEEPAVVGDGIESVGEGRVFTIPGDNVYPEGVSYNPANGKFYVGATSDGTLYEGDVNGSSDMVVFSEGGADGRTAAVGTKVDADGNLWVAGGGTGKVWVYDTDDGSLLAIYTTPETDSTFINDLAITDSGVYFTDSFRPTLWRVDVPQTGGLGGGEAEAFVDFTGSAINYVSGFNLNGIAPTEDGNTLIVVHSGEGELYKIDIATRDVSWIETGVIGLTAGDGLAVVGDTVYVMRNSFAELVAIELNDDLTSGGGGEVITSDLFGYPTTVAYTGNTFLVANSQFNNRNSGTPILPFTVAQIPAP